MDFYNRLGENYDRMTNPAKRLERESTYFAELIRRYSIQSALDIGCGTGHHMRLLAEAGVRVTGVDPSDGLLKQAESSLKEYGKRCGFMQGSFEKMPPLGTGSMDAVLSLGNTLPHVLRKNDFAAGLKAVRAVLKRSGVFVLHLLNYRKVIAEGNRIVNVTRDGAKTFVRFYDFLDTTLRFNILIITDDSGGLSHELISTELRPWVKDELDVMLEEQGFTIKNTFGDFLGSDFSKGGSVNLLIEAVAE